jgi:hypothetical protein
MSIWEKLEIYRVWYIHVEFYMLVGSFFSKEKITFYNIILHLTNYGQKA